MDYTRIYAKYNDELRPLISEFEGREEIFEEPILRNMAYVVDNLSECVQSEDLNNKRSHLEMAHQNLDEAVTNMYKYLVVSHHKRLKKFRRHFCSRQLELFDNGRFVGRFCSISKDARKCIRRAQKQKDFLSAKDDFKKAYMLYSDLEHDISKFEAEGAALQPQSTSILLTFIKMVLSVTISVGVAYFFSNYQL